MLGSDIKRWCLTEINIVDLGIGVRAKMPNATVR